MKKIWLTSYFLTTSLFLSGCMADQEVMIQNHSEAVLTKHNELQFRFTINDHLIKEKDVYKVKLVIENAELIQALGTNEFYYGEQTVYQGKSLQGGNDKQVYLTMEPLPLLKDIHTFKLEDMIRDGQAVKVEILYKDHVVGSAYITNFVSQL